MELAVDAAWSRVHVDVEGLESDVDEEWRIRQLSRRERRGEADGSGNSIVLSQSTRYAAYT